MVCKTLDAINLSWLPIEENMEMNTVKLAHKSLNNKLWPNDLKLALIEHKRTLQSSDLGPIIKQGGDYTFQQQATVYNNLPRDFKEINDFEAFSRKIKGFYKDKALARVLSSSSVLSLIFAFMSNYAIAVYCCNLLFCCFNFDLFSTLVSDYSFHSIFFSTGQFIYIL